MPCDVLQCAISDDQHVWQCIGSCGRKYHAVCAGVQRNHEEHIRTFMAPLCADCQQKFTTELGLKKLVEHQLKMVNSMDALMAVNHKICSGLKNLSLRETFESLETQLGELQDGLVNLQKKVDSSSTATAEKVSAILNDAHPADAFNTSVQQANSVLSGSLETLIARKLDEVQHGLDDQVKELQFDLSELRVSLAKEKAPYDELLEEIKSLAANIPTKESTPASNNNEVSLAEELSQNPKVNKSIDNSGWRFLGSKRVWKSDWTDYDSRETRRKEQSKQMQKANKRRKQRQRRYNNRISRINKSVDFNFDDSSNHQQQNQIQPNPLGNRLNHLYLQQLHEQPHNFNQQHHAQNPNHQPSQNIQQQQQQTLNLNPQQTQHQLENNHQQQSHNPYLQPNHSIQQQQQTHNFNQQHHAQNPNFYPSQQQQTHNLNLQPTQHQPQNNQQSHNLNHQHQQFQHQHQAFNCNRQPTQHQQQNNLNLQPTHQHIPPKHNAGNTQVYKETPNWMFQPAVRLHQPENFLY